MKKIANLFLILFLLAACLGLVDELLTRLLTTSPLSGPRNLSNLLCLFFGLIIYLGFGFNQHLPKLIFVPLLGYLFWGMLDYWPLDAMIGENYPVYAATGQLLLGLLALQLNLARNKQSRLLVPSQFVGDSFSGRNLLRFFLLNIPLLPIATLLLGFFTASSLIDEHTAGFVRLKPNGLYMVEKVYAQQEKKLRLTGMIHLGQREYYDELSASLTGKPLLVLAEGVSDEDGRLQGQFSYGNIAEMLGLTTQERTTFPGRPVSAASLDQPAETGVSGADILRADIDLIEFDAHSIAVLNALGKYILNSDSLVDGYARFNQWAVNNITDDSNRIIMADLIDKRNTAVLSYLPKALNKYDTVVIPWGALHMPGIEEAVREQGFELRESRERLSIDFLLLPYERIWGNLIGDGGE